MARDSREPAGALRAVVPPVSTIRRQRLQLDPLDFGERATDGARYVAVQAEMGPTLFFDDWSKKDRVDWGLTQSAWWYDDADHPDRKRRRQAEFLVHRFFPWSAIDSVGVYDEAIAKEVAAALAAATHRPAIRVQPDWYY